MPADKLAVSTDVYLPPEEVFEFLLDFEQYPKFSERLAGVRQYGDGDEGTEYEFEVTYSILSYTTRSRVTDIDEPRRIDWEIIKDIDAAGRWLVEPTDPPADRDIETASEVRMEAWFDIMGIAEQTGRDISSDRIQSLAEKFKPKVVGEAENIVSRIVADLEGEPREVDIEILETPV
jgi:carbon monoxide dehydrogenase subunit G